MVNESLQFYVDTLIAEAILTDPRLYKKAQSGIVSSLIQKIVGEVHDKVKEVKDSDHKASLVLGFMVPGMLAASGFPVLGFLAKTAQVMFGFDFSKIFSEIGSTIKDLISGGKQTTSQAVDNVVSAAFTNNIPPDPTEETIGKTLGITAKLSLRDAQLFKIAMADYVAKNPDVNLMDPEVNVKFAAGLFSSALATFISSKGKITKILISILGWMIKAILASAGFMVMGDVINKVVGNTNSSMDGQPSNSNVPTSAPISTGPAQTKFKVSPSYTEEANNGPMARWILQSDVSGIDSILINWADEIYPEARGQEPAMRSAATFNAVVNAIKAYNKGSPPNMTFIPRQWKSRKQVVDQFMNEVAMHSSPAAVTPATPGLIDV